MDLDAISYTVFKRVICRHFLKKMSVFLVPLAYTHNLLPVQQNVPNISKILKIILMKIRLYPSSYYFSYSLMFYLLLILLTFLLNY